MLSYNSTVTVKKIRDARDLPSENGTVASTSTSVGEWCYKHHRTEVQANLGLTEMRSRMIPGQYYPTSDSNGAYPPLGLLMATVAWLVMDGTLGRGCIGMWNRAWQW